MNLWPFQRKRVLIPKLRILYCIPSVSAMESYQNRFISILLFVNCIWVAVKNYMEDAMRHKTVEVEGVEAECVIAEHLFALLMKQIDHVL